MSNTNTAKSLFVQRLFGNKVLIYAVMAAVFVADVTAAVVAIHAQFDYNYWLYPVLFAVMDLLLVPVVILSNFRFRYSRVLPIVYMVVVVALTVLTALQGTNIFTITSAILFCVAHAFIIVALNFAMIFAGKTAKKGRGIGSWFITVVYVIIVVGYIFGMISCGYFGQGVANATRSIYYEYDEEADAYIASAVLSGRGNRVTIPAEYNGKPVFAVNCEIFNDASLKDVYLECGSDVEFIADSAMNSTGVNIYIDKSKIDDLKYNLYQCVMDDERYLGFANAIIPSGLADNEVYITFAYTLSSIAHADYEPIPMWVGTKGDVFDLGEHADGIVYAEDYDFSAESFLYTSYLNNQMVLSPVKNSSNALIDGTAIKSSLGSVELNFERVYAVRVADDNDTKYEAATQYKSYNDTGYRYVVSSDSTDIFGQYPDRKGFTIEWFYSLGNSNTLNPVSALSGTLSTTQTTVLHPRWTLSVPTISSVATNSQSNTFIYGDTIQLSGEASHTVDGVELTYEWIRLGGEVIGGGASYSITNVLPSQTDAYFLTVTASSDTVTSLTSESTQRIDITVNKREITIVWDLPVNTVYSGTDKTIVATANEDDLINGDVVNVTQSLYSVYNVGSYDVDVEIDGADMDALYTIKTAYRQRNVVITPYALTVSWENLPFIYNAQAQIPTASANGVGADSTTAIDLAVSGSKINAGKNYVATVVSNNANYTVDNDEQAFNIEPLLLPLEWTDGSSLPYTGHAQKTVASISGVLSGDEVNIIYSDWSKNINAGDHSVSVSLDNSNYTLPESLTECEYTITPVQLTISWSESVLTYNGAAQKTVATASGMVNDESVELIYTVWNTNKNVGDYSVTISITDTNYTLPSNITSEYEIVPKPLTLTWTSSVVYNGLAQKVPVVIDGIVNGEQVVLDYTDWSANKNVGDYDITASTADTNYTITNPTYNYEIITAPLTIIWTETAPIYNGFAQKPTATLVGAVNGETVTPIYSTWSGNINADDYSVEVSTTDTNYHIVSATVREYTISPKLLTVTWSNEQFIYNTAAQKPTATISDTANSEIVDFEYSNWSGNIDADNYTISISITDTNYSLPTTKTTSYRINPASLTLTWDEDREFVYTGLAQKISAVVDGVMPGESVELIYSDWTNHKNAGDYNVTVSITDTNYALPANVTEAYKIVAKDLTLAWGADSFVYTGLAQKPTAVVSGTVNGETVNLIYSRWSTNKNVGDYSVTVSITDNNYKLPDNITSEYEITPADLTIEWGNTSFVYNGAAQKPTATVGGAVNGEIINLIYSTWSDKKDVGNYNVSVSLNNNNYTLPANISTSYDVTPAPLTITWGSTGFIYNGAAQKPTATLGGVVSGENVALTYTTWSNNKNVGDYSVTVSIVDGNYTLPSNVTTEYSIAAKTLTISWSGMNPIYNGVAQKPSAALRGVVSGETVDLIYTDWSGNIDAGDYSVTVSITDTNYTLPANVTASYAISPKLLNVSWNTTSFIYNGAAQRPTASISGTAMGQTVDFTYSNTAANINAADGYSVSISITDGNYTLPANATTSYDIEPKLLSVVWSDEQFIYNGAVQGPTAIVSGEISGESVDFTYSDTSNNIDAGVHSVNISITDSNYALPANATTSYTIEAKEVTVTWGNTTFTYNGQAQRPTATFSGAVLGEDVSFTYSNTASNKNVGNYSVSVTVVDGNYRLATGASISYEIEAKVVTVSWSNTTFTYNGLAQKPTATFSGAVSGESVSFTYSSTSSNRNAGNYNVTATITNNNYTLSDGKTATTSYIISPKTVTVSWGNTTFTYNGNVQRPTANVSGAVSGYPVNLVYSSAGNVNVGSYSVTVSTNNTNYTLSGELTCNYTIVAKQVTLNWSSNNTVTYTGSPVTFTPSSASDSSVMSSLSYTYYRGSQQLSGAPTAAGTYTVVVTCSNGNYEITNPSTTFTVVEAVSANGGEA